MSDAGTSVSLRCVLAMLAVSVTACGSGGGDGSGEAADLLAARLLGSDVTDETREDHDCISDTVSDTFDDDTLQVLAEAGSLDDLDRPSREQLLQAALQCVSASQLAG